MRLVPTVALTAATIALLGFGTCGETLTDDDDDTPIGITGGDPTPASTTTSPPREAPDDAYLKGLPEAHRAHIAALSDPGRSPGAREALVALGEAALGSLQDAALLSSDPAVQGWAIEVIGRIPGERAGQVLTLIQDRTNTSGLVRVWAAAARVQRASTLAELATLAPLAASMPALQRPLGTRATALVDDDATAADLIALSQATPALQQALAEPILARGVTPLLTVMFTHADTATRRTAAGYLGTLGARDASAAATIAAAYAWTPKSETLLWSGGALYVPNLSWQQAEARVLVGHLVAWHLHCDRLGLTGERQQVYNNLRSVQLHRPAGLPWPSESTPELLRQWSGVVGAPVIAGMLERQGVDGDARYSASLEGTR